MFLENRSITNREELRKGYADWLSTRTRGNFFKAAGPGGSGESQRVPRYHSDYSQGEGRLSCAGIRKPGYKAIDCRSRSSISSRGGAGSPNVDQVTGSFPRGRLPTCYSCGREGHKSPDCTNKPKPSVTVKKEKVSESAHLNPVSSPCKNKKKRYQGKGQWAQGRHPNRHWCRP